MERNKRQGKKTYLFTKSKGGLVVLLDQLQQRSFQSTHF